MDASTTTLKTAICGVKYRRASWTCFILNAFSQQTGIDAINVYANRLLVQMEEQGGGKFPISPLQGTYIIGLSNLLPTLLALFTIQWLGRRTIYIHGQFFMSVFLFICGLCVLNGWNLASFVALCLFVATHNLS